MRINSWLLSYVGRNDETLYGVNKLGEDARETAP